MARINPIKAMIKIGNLLIYSILLIDGAILDDLLIARDLNQKYNDRGVESKPRVVFAHRHEYFSSNQSFGFFSFVIFLLNVNNEVECSLTENKDEGQRHHEEVNDVADGEDVLNVQVLEIGQYLE